MRLAHWYNDVVFTKDFQNFLSYLQLVPLVVVKVLSAVLANLLEPQVGCVDARRCNTPCDVLSFAYDNCWPAWNNGAANCVAITELQICEHVLTGKLVSKVRVVLKNGHARVRVVAMNHERIARHLFAKYRVIVLTWYRLKYLYLLLPHVVFKFIVGVVLQLGCQVPQRVVWFLLLERLKRARFQYMVVAVSVAL